MVNKENLTRREILPFSTMSLAPETTQYPGVSWGPLFISVVSTNFRSLGACTGTGGPPGYIAEFIFTSAGFGGGFWTVEKWWLISVDMSPDLAASPGEPSHSACFTTVAPKTEEKRSRRKRMFLIPWFTTCNCAPVTIERSSSASTGAVHTWEKYLDWTFSRYLRSYDSGWKLPFGSSVSWKILGKEERCCKWMDKQLLLLPSK